MNNDIKNVQALADYKIFVEAYSGISGVFDMKPHLDHGMFKELKNIDYFNSVHVLYGAVTWPHGQDIEPQTLLEGLEKPD
jgi:Protein of unknown function (DUF2442)